MIRHSHQTKKVQNTVSLKYTLKKHTEYQVSQLSKYFQKKAKNLTLTLPSCDFPDTVLFFAPCVNTFFQNVVFYLIMWSILISNLFN